MEDRWAKLEEIVRRVVREELSTIQGKKPKLKFEGGKWTGMTSEQLEVWKAAYPAVNVDEQIRLAAAWIVSNPNDAPKSNFARFLNAWLERHQNRAAIRSIPTDKKLLSSGEPRLCHYCDKRATGTVSGIPTCSAHVHDAMDGKRVA